MRRIGCYIINALTVLSLLLCVATVGLWVRSYTHTEGAYYCTGRWYWSVQTVRAGFVATTSPDDDPEIPVGWTFESVPVPNLNGLWHTQHPSWCNSMGFYADTNVHSTHTFIDGTTNRGWVKRYELPMWFACFALGLLPAGRMFGMVRRRWLLHCRRQHGQ